MYGYLEAFSREFEPAINDKLSENGVIAGKTMNTLLHVFEAYTELYRVSGNMAVAERMKQLLKIFGDKVYNRDKGRQEVFFDQQWNSIIDLYSYGHDIEAAWLLDRGTEILGDGYDNRKVNSITAALTENIYQRAYSEHSLSNEKERGIIDSTRVWWVQAEAVVGFINGYQKQVDNDKYLLAAKDIWQYIKMYLIDRRKDAEWYWSVNSQGKPNEKPIVEEWKCPYHNGRMCMEIIRRAEDASSTILCGSGKVSAFN